MGTDIRMPETEREEEVIAWKGTRRPSRERRREEIVKKQTV